ncbi:DUF1800 domain-containing protein [Flavobacterium arcticum]|uniref:DUF1800 domain-containing protein n=1 Tax=Flavobacterium arcticum TaxID=1784713 RepID=A0A345H954_9FLAO|nr:DUF1800 domain-containing protein [Flavobacterium arcticum]AXG73114.1 DUF1800 domain-containing protein [Flavobacterium arcticum]KAF2512906.1 DUF1800 domain-containing protein [Flavobacterium arcticum]
MDVNTLWSLRLGFSGKQAQTIKEQGINTFLQNAFATKPDITLPDFFEGSPKTLKEVKAVRQSIKNDVTKARARREKEKKIFFDLKSWWINKMATEEYPLREKMTLFWHNHYVTTYKKVKINYWLYSHNTLLRENAFGNFREITKQILRTNAMIIYLDNNKNTNKGFNENLSRELLELFTLGEGNYTETDIKNGAHGLAGLVAGNEGGYYRTAFQDDEPFTYFGEKGVFKSDEMVDIIFKQKSAPYFITRKLLKWFIYDNPPEELVKYYGDYLREQDYEIEPLLTKIVTEEFDKSTAGSKIKDPLTYVIQLYHELNIKEQNHKLTALFIRQQGMDLFNQPNVKGWSGGNYWLTAQLYLQRNRIANLYCNGKNFSEKMLRSVRKSDEPYTSTFDITIEWNHNNKSKEVITELKDRLLFDTDTITQENFESILKYDFDPTSKGADNGVLRLFNYMVKTPEFQLI